MESMVLKMRKMKDSGIEWIGEIPEGWEVAKLKNIVSIVRGGSPRPIEAYMSDNDNDVNWIRISDTEKGSKYITHTSRKLIASGISKSRFIKRGSLILTNSMSFGEPYILDIDGCIHDGWVAFSDFKKIDKEFLYYFLTSPLAKIQFEQQVDGGVVKNLNIDKIGDTVILLPSLIDQNKIIAHLDSLTSETNSLLSKTITSIEEYKKLKQSVITQAVTKAIYDDFGNPSKFRKLRSLCDVLSKGTTPKDIETQNDEFYCIRYLKSENIVSNQLNLNPTFFITAETNNSLERSKLNSGDILFVIAGASIGKVAITTADFLPANTNQAVAFIRLSSSYQYATKYIWYFLQSDVVKQLIALSAVQSAQPNLSLEDLGAMRLPLPDQMGCLKITDYLDAKCAEIDKLIAKKEQLVKELESYKKSLIYEVVTGKREV